MKLPNKSLQPHALRLFDTLLFLVIGGAFVTYGLVIVTKERTAIGFLFVLLGLLMIAGMLVIGWRLRKVGVRTVGEQLIIGRYFSESRVHLPAVKRIFRGVDATVIKTTQGETVIDDAYFDTAESRRSFFDNLRNDLKDFGVTLPSESRDPSQHAASHPDVRSLNPATNIIRRSVLSSVIALTGTFILCFGAVAIKNGGLLLGLGFCFIGVVAIAAGFLYLWRGGKIRVQIVDGDLVVGEYFKDIKIPLGTVTRVFRSSDATVIETRQGKTVIDDFYFANPESRNVFFESLMDRLSPQAAGDAKELG